MADITIPPGTQGDYVPDYHDGPVAAGGQVATLSNPAAGYDRLRHLVPTGRQVEEGAPETDVAALEEAFRAPAVEEPGRRSRAAWAKDILSTVNPWAIEGPKLVLLVFGLQALLGGWDEQVLVLAGPEITASFGVSVSSFLWISTLVTASLTVLGLPLGYLVDRTKRVNLVRIGAVGHSAGVLARVVAPTYGTYALADLGGRLVTSPASAAVGPLTTDYFPSRARARVLGFLGIAGTVGGLISAPIVGFLVLAMGWRAAVTVLAVPSLLVALLVFLLREPVRGAMDRLELGVSAEQAAVEQSKPTFREAIRGAWAIRTVRLTIIAEFVGGFTAPVGIVMGFISASLYTLNPFERSLITWVTLLASIPLLMVGTALTQRLLLKNPATIMVLMAGAAVFPAILYVVVLFHPPLWLYVATKILAPVPFSFVIMGYGIVRLQATPARFRGVAAGLSSPFLVVSSLLGGALVATATSMGLTTSLMVFMPFYAVAGLVNLAAAGGISRDIRAARAAALAEEESAKSRAERQNKLLVCRDVDLVIDEVQILSHVDLDVREGEIVALVGTNGAGKSTLLRAICGLQPATNGAIFFDGIDATFRPTHQLTKDGIVYMPGGQGVFPLMSVRDNLHSAAWMTRKQSEALEEDVERVLTMFPRLRERLDAQAGSMSGGEQQMLALGQAFLMKPKLLMIDELSLGLAPAIVEQLLDTLREMRDEGVTIILVEQSLNVALTVADRAVFMEKGAVHFDGPVDQLLARPDLVRSVFMGGAGGGSVTGGRRRATSELDERQVLLSAEGISVSFGGVHALRDVNLEVAAGEVVGIIGPNGAGKTTLFDALSGYLTPDEGSVVVAGHDVTRLSPDARARLGLGRAFQNARLFPPLTVRENIAVALERRTAKSTLLAAVWAPPVRKSERQLRERVDGFIELLGLTAYADKFVRELSTGTRRAVEVACQMAAEPAMLMLDEPSSGLAQAEVEALGPALTRIVKETGCGLLLIEHDLNLITQISDRLVAMVLGEVVADGAPADVLRNPVVLESYLAASSSVLDRSGSRVGSVLDTITTDLARLEPSDHHTSD